MTPSTGIRPDINVTPLIDILLVMLVIFLAAVTLTQQAIESQIPREAARRIAETGPQQIMLEVSADRAMAVNHQSVTLAQLTPFLKEIYSKRTDKTIYVAAAGSLPYGAVIDVMDAVKGAGIDRMGVITDGMRANAIR